MLLQIQIRWTNTRMWQLSVTCGVCFIVFFSLGYRKRVVCIVSICSIFGLFDRNGPSGTWLQSVSEKKTKPNRKWPNYFEMRMWNVKMKWILQQFLFQNSMWGTNFNDSNCAAMILFCYMITLGHEKSLNIIVSKTMQMWNGRKMRTAEKSTQKESQIGKRKRRKIENTKAYEIGPYFCHSLIVSFVRFFHAQSICAFLSLLLFFALHLARKNAQTALMQYTTHRSQSNCVANAFSARPRDDKIEVKNMDVDVDETKWKYEM